MAGYKVYDAHQKGDTKKVIEEGGQLVGSLGGGALGGWAAGTAVLILGVGTGGVGLVVAGLFVAGSAYAGGEVFKAGAKVITDEINGSSK